MIFIRACLLVQEGDEGLGKGRCTEYFENSWEYPALEKKVTLNYIFTSIISTGCMN